MKSANIIKPLAVQEQNKENEPGVYNNLLL